MEIEEIIRGEFVNFNGKYSIYASDFKGNIIAINDSEKYNAASCIKVYILVALFNEIRKGNKSLDDVVVYEENNHVNGSGILRFLTPGLQLTVKDMATLMMIISDNVATNIMIDYVGIENINNTIKEIGCNDTKLYCKFESGDNKLFGETTAKDYGHVFELISKNLLWNNSISEQIIDIVKNQKYHEMISDGISKMYTKTNNDTVKYIVSKSGKYNSVRNDGGIVATKYGDYILVVFIKNFDDYELLNDEYIYNFGRKVSQILFQRYIALKGKFNL